MRTWYRIFASTLYWALQDIVSLHHVGRFQVRDIYGKRKASSEKKKTDKEISIAIFFIIALKKPGHAMQIELLKQTVTDHEIISCWIYIFTLTFQRKPRLNLFLNFLKFLNFFFFIRSVVNRSQVRNTHKRRSDACVTFWPMSTWHGVMAEKRSFRVQNQHRYCV